MVFSLERAKEKISWQRRMDADTRPSSKFRVVLEAVRSQKPDAEVARAYQVHPITLSKWNTEFLEKGAEVFGAGDEVRACEQKISKLGRMLGQKEVELALSKISWRSVQRRQTD